MTDAEKKLIIRLEQLEQFKSQLLNVVYTKPAAGIPKADLAQAVQDTLDKADSALQASDITELTSKVSALEALIEADSDGAINKFNEIVTFLANITDSQTLDGIVSGINSAIAAKYTKPDGGIPKTDLAADVQTSLGKADTALQEHQDISGKVDKIEGKGLSTNDYTDTDKAKVEALVYATNSDIDAMFE